MKKRLLALCFLTITLQASAFSFQDQLEARNSHWAANRTLLVAENAKVFKNDREFVQAHFAAVEVVLLHADVSALSPAQVEARYRNIQVLHDYAARGIFPANHCSYSTPVFIDEFNTHCAVGHLMQQSGFDAMAMRIASRNNLVHSIDINDPEVYVWQEASGFTMEELALIQPSYYAPPSQFEQQYACTTAYFNEYAWNGTKSIGQGTQTEQPQNIWYSGECENGVLNGKWEQYHSPGEIWIRGYFKDGKKNGEWKYYTQRARKDSMLQKLETWLNGKLHGPFASYDYADTKTIEGNYSNGLKVGAWKYWSGSRLSREENYTAGKLHGSKIQYYVHDTSLTTIAQHDEYSVGILQTRRFYDQSGKLQTQSDYIADNRYRSVKYSTAGKISMVGEEILIIRTDSFENMMYPNLPKTYYEQEGLVKVGRWTHFPNYGHHLTVNAPPVGVTEHDSLHLYYSGTTDSIYAMVRYWKTGVKQCMDTTSYASLQPNQPLGYYRPPNQDAHQTWTYADDVMQSYTGTWPTGSQRFRYDYKDGKLYNAIRYYPDGGFHEIWSMNTVGGQSPLYYKKMDKQRMAFEEGPIIDTTTRYGEWTFRDSVGTVIAKGEYINGLKEGKWMETYPDGTRWEGEYKKGKKKGTWVEISPAKDGKIRKEKF